VRFVFGGANIVSLIFTANFLEKKLKKLLTNPTNLGQLVLLQALSGKFCITLCFISINQFGVL
jgi:hypothetical protein